MSTKTKMIIGAMLAVYSAMLAFLIRGTFLKMGAQYMESRSGPRRCRSSLLRSRVRFHPRLGRNAPVPVRIDFLILWFWACGGNPARTATSAECCFFFSDYTSRVLLGRPNRRKPFQWQTPRFDSRDEPNPVTKGLFGVLFHLRIFLLTRI